MRPNNRAWGFSRNDRNFPLENRLRCPELRQKSRPSPTVFTSGIPQWPSRDLIGEMGGVNLYGFLGNDGSNRLDVLGMFTEWSDCTSSRDVGKKKFQLVDVILSGWTADGRLPKEHVADFAKLYTNIQTFSNLSSLAQMGSGLAKAFLEKTVTNGAAADVVGGALGTNNPADVKDFVVNALANIAESQGRNGAKGAMITIRYRCRTCKCHNKYFFFGREFRWDYPAPKDDPYSIEAKGDNEEHDKVIPFTREVSDLRITLEGVESEHIADAIFKSRVKCEGEDNPKL